MTIKKFLTLILAIIMVFSVSACGSSATDSNSDAETAQPSTESNDDGEVYELTFSMHDAETQGSSQFIKAWGDQLEEASNGRIKINWYFGGTIASAMESMDACTNGVADLVWSAPALFTGRFHTTLVASLPMLNMPANGDGGEILWNMYEKYDYISDEWDGFKVIALYPNGGACLLTTDVKADSFDAFKNLRIRTTTSSLVAFLNAMGAAPVSFSTTETFENLEKNVADGTISDWNFTSGNRLYDVCDYAATEPINSAIGCILMNENSYANLPSDLQELIDEYSGLYASRMGNELAGTLENELMQGCADEGLELYTFPDSMSEALEAAAEAGRQAWYEEVSEYGIDGEQVYNDLIAEMQALGY